MERKRAAREPENFLAWARVNSPGAPTQKMMAQRTGLSVATITNAERYPAEATTDTLLAYVNGLPEGPSRQEARKWFRELADKRYREELARLQ